MKLSYIIEGVSSNQAKVERINNALHDIAQGLSLGSVSRKYGMHVPQLSLLKKQMTQAGWQPGQPPPPEVLRKYKEPVSKEPKYPGMSQSEIASISNKAMWSDPEKRAALLAQRQTPEYREMKRQSTKAAHEANPEWAKNNREFMTQKLRDDPDHRRKAAIALGMKRRAAESGEASGAE